MTTPPCPVLNVANAAESVSEHGVYWGAGTRDLVPAMRAAGGSLGVRNVRVPPGRTACPFHTHAIEDEVFYVLSGTGVLRYGEALHPLRAGDCVSCPAGTGVAHQLANTGDVDLVYLAIGRRDPHEVCTYPDSGKVMVRSLQTVGYLEGAPYLDGEPDVPRVFELHDEEQV